MTVLLALIGLFAGAFVGGALFHGDTGWLGAVVGAAIGVLAGRVQALQQRLGAAESSLQLLQTSSAARAATEAAQRESVARERAEAAHARHLAASASVSAPMAETDTTAAARVEKILAPAPAAKPAPLPDDLRFDLPELSAPALPPKPVLPEPATSRPVPPRAAPIPMRRAEPDAADRAVQAVKRWFTEGNVPVKIGVLVLFLGVGALLKYAADQNLLRVPIQLRLAGIAAVAMVGLVFAWRKRESHRAFALSLQGGAIGVLLLVVFAAYRLYALIPAEAAFASMVILVAGVGVLAVAQDAIALAVLGIVGGFLAPILTSSNTGNHVALFSYYAVLNAAIFAIAWFKLWRALNLIGFVFTFGIATAWGVLKYQPELFDSTEPFLILFYLFYLAIPVLYALRGRAEAAHDADDAAASAAQRRGFVDGSLVFGTPLVAFPLQAGLLQGDAKQLAVSAMLLAFVHIAVAWFARLRLAFTLLGQSHALLALGFATLAVPLALSARSTACAWAVEGAALVWLGLRQQRQLPRWIGYALQLAAGASLLSSGLGSNPAEGSVVIFNGDFLALALLSLAGYVSERLTVRDENSAPLGHLLFAWSTLWWFAAGFSEIARYAEPDNRINWILGFLAFSTWLSSELRRRYDWTDCQWPALAGILAAPLLILPMAEINHGPLSGIGALAWLGWFVASLRAQANLSSSDAPILPFLHFVHTWTWVLVLASQALHLSAVRYELVPVWQVLATLAPVALAFAGHLARWPWLRLPLDEHAESARHALLISTSLLLGGAWFLGLFFEGEPTPLRYIPILNPLEMAQIGFVLVLLLWFRHADAEGSANLPATLRAQAIALIGFALLTSITLRSVHFLGDVAWGSELMRSALAQACLSVVWCLAGLTGMLIGAARRSRPIWIGGAALVGLVIAKLILVDRHHLSDLSAIFGVLAVGGLLMIVGWFAPNPPRGADAELSE